MRDRLASWLLPTVMAGLTAVIVVGLVVGGGPPVDRVERLAGQLRCPVCRSESVADSPSDTARAMRDQIASFVAAGRSDRWILDYYTDRYGRWILLDPPMSGDTLLLWLLPAVAGLVGVAAVVRRRRSREQPPDELGATDRARIDAAVTQLRRTEQERR